MRRLSFLINSIVVLDKKPEYKPGDSKLLMTLSDSIISYDDSYRISHDPNRLLRHSSIRIFT